jgi:hypothetical protein
MEMFEKIAYENDGMAEEIIKVAAETVDSLSDNEIIDEFLTDLVDAGYDLNDPDTIAEVEALLDEDPDTAVDYAVEKAAEMISEDIAKVAAGSDMFETDAAAKAVTNYFDLHGAANLGSMFGPSAVGVGSAITPNATKNIGGGYGRLIGGSNINPHNVNAAGKVSGILGSLYPDNIRTASDTDTLEHLYRTIEAAADAEGQSTEEYLQDLAYEALEEEATELLLND